MADADRPRHRPARSSCTSTRPTSETGSAHWIARYTFSTGRPVVNDIRASFRFADGLIADHVDEFDFRNWAKQALGPSGHLVALLPPLRRKARAKALEQLAAFTARRDRLQHLTPFERPRERPTCEHMFV